MHPVNNAIDALVADALNNQPRSQQKLIGPSEIGTSCIRCLARKLAGVEKLPPQGIADVAWLPAIGTAVHAMLEQMFDKDNLSKSSNGETPRWLIEEKLVIGKIGDHEITGSCDLYDLETNTVIDHKVVGATKLTSIPKKGPGDQYRVQAHLYGLGWSLRGYEVNEVAVKFYPRNNPSLLAGYFWTEKYDENIAFEALQRANDIYDSVVSSTDLNEYLLTLETSKDCFSCSDYPSLDVMEPSHEDNMFTQPTPYVRR
jgi:hypothetical protein